MMTRSWRLFALAATAFAIVATPGTAHAQRTDAKVRVKLVKPLVMTTRQDLDFGTIIGAGGAGTLTVRVDPDGTLDCPAPLICTGNALPGIINIKGSNRRDVLITASASDLVNPLTGARIAFRPIASARVSLPNSGNKGTDLEIGGEIDIPEDAAGNYEAVIEITADYE